MFRRGLRALLLLAALVAVLATVLGGYARHALVPASAFGNRAADTLDAPAVRTALAREVAGRLGAAVGLPAPLAGELGAAVRTATQRRGFRRVVRQGAETVHAQLLADPDRPVRLTLAGAEDQVRRVLERRVPAAAALPRVGDPVIAISDADALGHALNAADRLAALMPAALVAAIALFGLAALLAPGPRAALAGIGLTLLLAGAAVVAGTVVGRSAAVAAAPADAPPGVAGAVWDAFLGDLRGWGVALALLGVAVLVAGALARRRGARQYVTAAR
jgi:hypothetical protein